MRRLLILAAAALFTLAARAGGLSVLPTRIDLAAGRAVQSLMLTNTSEQTVTVETHVLVWPEGAPDQLANDLVVTPPVITLPPSQRMRVRIGLLRQPKGEVEQAYRLYFTELPQPSPLQGAGVGVRLRIGIPVFVAPSEPQPTALAWSVLQTAEGWRLQVRNPGNVHARIAEARLGEVAGANRLDLPSPYVLAHSTLTIPLRDAVQAGSRVRWLDGDEERESPLATSP